MNSLTKLLEFPSSALLAVSFLLTAFVVHHYGGKSKVVRVLSGTRTAQVLLAAGAVLLGIEGVWAVPIHTTGYFVAYMLTLLMSLSLAVLDGIQRKAKKGFILNHLGMLLIGWAALFGAPDVTKCKIMIYEGQPNNVAITSDSKMLLLPFQITLERFAVDYYEDGHSPKQFTSYLTIGGERMQTAVNNPCSYDGYTLFQDSYDTQRGQYSVLLLVRDPWLPVIYIGMVLLALGSTLLLFGKWKAKVTVPTAVVLATLFTVVTVAKINFGTLMPALRSWWFVPHLIIYMVAYSLMALALLIWLAEASGKMKKWQGVSENLIRSSSALLIIGMLTGSVWARQAWGDYWAWDPKENWAAVTWLITLLHLHMSHKRGWKGFAVLTLAFLALQITWYGVNYLPSATHSMHTYK